MSVKGPNEAGAMVGMKVLEDFISQTHKPTTTSYKEPATRTTQMRIPSPKAWSLLGTFLSYKRWSNRRVTTWIPVLAHGTP